MTITNPLFHRKEGFIFRHKIFLMEWNRYDSQRILSRIEYDFESKKRTDVVFCFSCTACGDPLVGNWLGIEYCDGPNDSYCTTFPLSLQEGFMSNFSLVIAGDVTGEKIYFAENAESSEYVPEPTKKSVEANYESARAYTNNVRRTGAISLLYARGKRFNIMVLTLG